MKIHNRVKFHLYNIYSCRVKNVHSFSRLFSINEMDIFQPLLPQILPNFAEIFNKGSIQGKKNTVVAIAEKIKFLRKRDVPGVCTFASTLTPRFPLKMAKIGGN